MENVPPMSPRKPRTTFSLDPHAKSARSQKSGGSLVLAARGNASTQSQPDMSASASDLERYQGASASKMSATGLATPPTSQNEEMGAARMLISPPPESMLRATRSSGSRSSVPLSPDVSCTRSRTSSPKKPSPKKRKRRAPVADDHDDGEEVVMTSEASTIGYESGVKATPNPKQRKQPRRSLDDDDDIEMHFPSVRVEPKTPIKAHRATSVSQASSSKLNSLRSPHAANPHANYLTPFPLRTHSTLSTPAQRRSRTTPPYEPPAERFTPPREIVTPSPVKAAQRRKSTPRVRLVEIGKKKLELILTVKKEPPEVDLHAPLPPASPTEDPLLLHGGPRRRKGRTSQELQSDPSFFESSVPIESDGVDSSSIHIPSDGAPPPPTSDVPSDSHMDTSSPHYANVSTVNPVESTPVNASTSGFDLTLDTSTITPVFRFDDVLLEANADAWSSDSESDDAAFSESGEYTGRFTMMTIPTKADPPSSCTRQRIEAWGNPVSPFPEKARRLSALLQDPRAVNEAIELDLDLGLEDGSEEDKAEGEPTAEEAYTEEEADAEEDGSLGLQTSPIRQPDCASSEPSRDGSENPFVDSDMLKTPTKVDQAVLRTSSPAEDDEEQTPVKQIEVQTLIQDLTGFAEHAEPQSTPENARYTGYGPEDSLTFMSPGPTHISGEDLTGFDFQSQDYSYEAHDPDESVVLDESQSFEVPLNDEDDVVLDEDEEVEDFLTSDAPEAPEYEQEHLDGSMEDNGQDEDDEEYEEEVTVDRELSDEVEPYSDEAEYAQLEWKSEDDQSEQDAESDTVRLPVDADTSPVQFGPAEKTRRLRLDESVSTLVNDETDDTSSESEPEIAPDVVKIIADDPRAAARAAAILRMHDYDCLSQEELEHQKRSHNLLGSALRNARRKSASEAGVSKHTPQDKRRHTFGGLVDDKVYIPGSSSVTLPQLLKEAEEDIRTPGVRSSRTRIRTPFQIPASSSSTGSHSRTPIPSSPAAIPVQYEGPHAWGKADWKRLDACFTDERLALALQRGLMFDTLADAEEVDLDEVVDRFLAQTVPEGFTLDEYGWSRDELLKRARALRRKQGSGRVAPPTPSGYTALMSPATCGMSSVIRRFDSISTQSAPRLSALCFDITSDQYNTPMPKKDSRYSQLMDEVNSWQRSSSPARSVTSSHPSSAADQSGSFLPAPDAEAPAPPPPSLVSRVKGFFSSYLPIASKSARPIAKNPFQPAQPGLPIPPPEFFQKPRAPIETPLPKPQEKPAHPRELVHLQHVPLPKPSMIQRPAHPRKFVRLRPAPRQERLPSRVDWDAGSRRSSGGSVKELVQTFESLKDQEMSKPAKPTWIP